MNKRELIAALAAATGLSQTQAAAVVKSLFGVPNGIIARTLREGGQVRITGFGSFGTKRRRARMGRNPGTGESITIPAAVTPVFQSAKGLKDRVSDKMANGGPRRPAPKPAPKPAVRKGAPSEPGPPKSARRLFRRRRGGGGGSRGRGSPPPERPDMAAPEEPEMAAPDEPDLTGPGVIVSPSEDMLDLGPPRSGRRPRGGGGSRADPVVAPEPSGGIPTTLSAEGPKEVDVDQDAEIKVRLELTSEARPLAHSTNVVAAPAEPIFVIVRVEGEALQLVDPPLKTAQPPASGVPRELSFAIRGRAAGRGTVAIDFQQGSTVLAALTFDINVKGAGASPEPQTAVATAAQGDVRDDAVLRMLIQPPSGGDPFYTFLVTSKQLGLFTAKFTSPPFALGSGQASDAPLAFARSVYERIETEILEVRDDATLLDRRLKGVGADLCRQLLPEDLVRRLWDQRDEIDTIEINSFEPYIPWEVLRLRHPDLSGAAATDDRHFGEYRLVRTLSNRRWPAETLGRGDWRYVLAEYPNGLFEPPTGEGQFLTTRLKALGVEATPISPQPLDVLDALEEGSFDVIHFACHGLSSLDDIDASALIIGDRKTSTGTTEAVQILPTDVVDANLDARKPLVFLNACQSGRMAPSLTDMGGWPKALFAAGAGAFVGTSWSVHERPAVTFAETFYDGLLSEKTLAEAAGDGRQAIKGQGASWLAFTVYGLPSARMEPATPIPE